MCLTVVILSPNSCKMSFAHGYLYLRAEQKFGSFPSKVEIISTLETTHFPRLENYNGLEFINSAKSHLISVATNYTAESTTRVRTRDTLVAASILPDCPVNSGANTAGVITCILL